MSSGLFHTSFTYYLWVAIKWIGIIFGLLILTYAILVFFGYDLNWALFVQESDQCIVNYQNCLQDALYGGADRFTCESICVDPDLIIVPHESIMPIL